MELIENKHRNNSSTHISKQLQIQPKEVLEDKDTRKSLVLEKKKSISDLTVENIFENYNEKPENTLLVSFESIGNEKW
ncbi:hypothetical protein MUA77_12390 [Mammaliicoccus sciuri]|uniref:hypothetical protein n=1 Tax=Mammaliicoccus sciuri TaxID=1296 RepID=UPI0021D20F7D|nr:hypothetical protein [Mammaliicoccus sciuri]UXU83589.1 hypothetical protein MUA77_12390 [Mammaliicoccus sciuri]UXU93435.1 hypothetical protein MUA42_12400 [Mammaliicoccus sciuri]UXV15383.1 hypothetical protein MUA89_12660 [Mammaliicoccus sciuri]UXV23648.1 hypothetical protein MUA49_12390 [Mammaliicoccus sciuri]UXV26426.1 hypothetical protein MUA96_12645 [Mammaliicoccus sciuri]